MLLKREPIPNGHGSVRSEQAVSQFAADVRAGLGKAGQKTLPPTYFYDDVGSALFEVITQLPEYGLTRADERLLNSHASSIASHVPSCRFVIELGSGSGRKTRPILESLAHRPLYYPIDVSAAALDACAVQLSPYAQVQPVLAEYLDGVRMLMDDPPPGPVLVLFLGSTIGNFDRPAARAFLNHLSGCLRPGDALLIGIDLVKDRNTITLAYDDPAGVTAAFNRNVLARINRELGGNFDVRAFQHEVRYDDRERRIEMHLRSERQQRVIIRHANLEVGFEAGETIWTESSHKYEAHEFGDLASSTGFAVEATWTDSQWPFAESLWIAGSR